MTRTEIRNKIKSNENLIEKLRLENREFLKQDYLLSDELQQYYEKEEEVVVTKRPKTVKKELRGYIKFIEEFEDADTGERFSVERNVLVRVNGRWV